MKLLAASLAAAMSLALAGCVPRGSGAGFSGTPVEPPKSAADATLTDGTGASAHVLDGSAAATFLFFGYTHCPDECPLALASLGTAYRKLPAATAARVRVVFVTVDPARDTPSVINAYVRKFDPRIVGLGGSRATLARLWQAYGVHVDPRSREIGHGDEIYAIDRSSHIILIYPPDATPGDLAKDAAILAAT